MKKRIWELDAFRGLCLLGMVLIHLIYDLTELYGFVSWNLPVWFVDFQEWAGSLFLILSGLCATLGSRPVRRGLTVLAGGLLCFLVTWAMAALGLADRSVIIYFGVLHCLGICMLLWPLFEKWDWKALLGLGLVLAALGVWLRYSVRVDFPWLIPLGFLTPGFASSDYFPLLPHLGFFLMGGALGKTAYRDRKSRFPQCTGEEPVLGFLCLCGRNSLWIYLLHQPVLSGILWILDFHVKR